MIQGCHVQAPNQMPCWHRWQRTCIRHLLARIARNSPQWLAQGAKRTVYAPKGCTWPSLCRHALVQNHGLPVKTATYVCEGNAIQILLRYTESDLRQDFSWAKHLACAFLSWPRWYDLSEGDARTAWPLRDAIEPFDSQGLLTWLEFLISETQGFQKPADIMHIKEIGKWYTLQGV